MWSPPVLRVPQKIIVGGHTPPMPHARASHRTHVPLLCHKTFSPTLSPNGRCCFNPPPPSPQLTLCTVQCPRATSPVSACSIARTLDSLGCVPCLPCCQTPCPLTWRHLTPCPPHCGCGHPILPDQPTKVSFTPPPACAVHAPSPAQSLPNRPRNRFLKRQPPIAPPSRTVQP